MNFTKNQNRFSLPCKVAFSVRHPDQTPLRIRRV